MKRPNQVARFAATIIAVCLYVSLIASLPAATQSTAQDQALEAALRAEYEGKFWLIDGRHFRPGISISLRNSNLLLEEGDLRLFFVSRLRLKNNRLIELTTHRAFRFDAELGEPKIIQGETEQYQFTCTSCGSSLEIIARRFRETLTDADDALNSFRKFWTPLPHGFPFLDIQVDESQRYFELIPGLFSWLGDLKGPICLECPEPAVSKSDSGKYTGTSVVVWAIVTSRGRVTTMVVLWSADPALDKEAVRMISRWKFKPGMKDGKPVATATNIEVSIPLH